jgi:hypothetical protein
MNHHYRNETFAPRFLLTMLALFVAAMVAVGLYAESERHPLDIAEKSAPSREIILLGDDTWITITGADRDADVRVHHGGIYE